jgi:hypothetical protein
VRLKADVIKAVKVIHERRAGMRARPVPAFVIGANAEVRRVARHVNATRGRFSIKPLPCKAEIAMRTRYAARYVVRS